jgi:hypothetical protein
MNNQDFLNDKPTPAKATTPLPCGGMYYDDDAACMLRCGMWDNGEQNLCERCRINNYFGDDIELDGE